MRRIVLVAALLIGCDSSHEADAAGEVRSKAVSEIGIEIAQSDGLARAQAAIDAGHPWRATQLVAPLLRDAKTRTPAAQLVAARAAAGWGGWSIVEQLLSGATWIDARYDGEARELLARAAFERDADTLALTHARAAVRDAKTAADRRTRVVLLGRALERNNMFDSAAARYTSAADSFQPIRDWLVLRAAGSESDSTKRAHSLASITRADARERVAWTDAQARERFGDALGAATRYAALGATVTALRLRLSVAADSDSRASIENELIVFVRGHPGAADAKTAVEVLDKGFTRLSATEELTIARSLAASGPVARAVTAFQRAASGGARLADNDRLLWAQVLARVGRSRDALAQLDAVEGPLAAQAAYQRARVLLTSSTGDATRASLRTVISKFSNDTGPAGAALYLLADLTTDLGDDAQARALYRQVYRVYPSSPYADDARFRAAMIGFVLGDEKGAALAFDSLTTLMPRSDEANAARYWSGRAWSKAGNDSLARARWSELAGQQSASYYAVVAARRLGQKPWVPAAHSDAVPALPSVDSAFARIELLEHLGMDAEARFEYEALDAAASRSTDQSLAIAHAFLAHGQPSRAIRIAQKLIDAGARDARVYRLLFPLVDRDELARDAKDRALDPALVAGLIRQESNFAARAVSPAGARGLMQLLPSVAEDIARASRFPVWHSALLLDADANLQLGTAHLATYMSEYGALPRVLAAYNAGGSRVTRWSAKGGTDDPEVFVERIPFVETRDYVRLVQRNAEYYRMLYSW